MEKTLCIYNPRMGFWVCDSDNWEVQEKGCQYSLKSTRKPQCMHLVDFMRCDNWYAQPEHQPSLGLQPGTGTDNQGEKGKKP